MKCEHQLTSTLSVKVFVKEGIGCEPTPVLYQYITDKIFKKLIEEHSTLPENFKVH